MPPFLHAPATTQIETQPRWSLHEPHHDVLHRVPSSCCRACGTNFYWLAYKRFILHDDWALLDLVRRPRKAVISSAALTASVWEACFWPRQLSSRIGDPFAWSRAKLCPFGQLPNIATAVMRGRPSVPDLEEGNGVPGPLACVGWRLFLAYLCCGSVQREMMHVTAPLPHLACGLLATCAWLLGALDCRRGGQRPCPHVSHGRDYLCCRLHSFESNRVGVVARVRHWMVACLISTARGLLPNRLAIVAPSKKSVHNKRDPGTVDPNARSTRLASHTSGEVEEAFAKSLGGAPCRQTQSSREPSSGQAVRLAGRRKLTVIQPVTNTKPGTGMMRDGPTSSGSSSASCACVAWQSFRSCARRRTRTSLP
jgi:hypothetical protein